MVKYLAGIAAAVFKNKIQFMKYMSDNVAASSKPTVAALKDSISCRVISAVGFTMILKVICTYY